jgi:hypothetical protein
MRLAYVFRTCLRMVRAEVRTTDAVVGAAAAAVLNEFN